MYRIFDKTNIAKTSNILIMCKLIIGAMSEPFVQLRRIKTTLILR